jgi:outer membrane lipoprotein-sorting protein
VGALAAAAASPAASPAAGADAKTALADIFTGFAGVKSFRAKIAGKLAQPGAPSTNMEMEVVLPDRIRGKMGMSGQTMELVMVAGTTYVKVGAAPWIKAPSNVPVDLNVLDPKRYDTASVSNVKLVGPEVVDGTPTLAYTYEIASPAVPPAKTSTLVNAKMWVGVADKLPRKLEMTSPDGSVTTVTYGDYNAPITIEAPV